jgi:phosphatidylinositol alpha-1,6-mannosyltransferase
MRRGSIEVLGLFPGLHAEVIGGIEVSGRVAWEAVTLAAGRGRCRLISTGGPAGRLGLRSKLGAIAAASRGRWSAGTVLVWHLGLLKLLPFLRVGDARIVVFLHGIEAWRRPDWLTRRLLGRVDLFLSNSQHTWDRFTACNPASAGAAHRVTYLGLGSPPAQSPPPPGSVPVALMIGRLVRAEDYKGHREMIAAWPQVRAELPGAELWIVGDGNLRPDLEREARRGGVGGHVRFWGQVSEAEKEARLLQARCLALPSRAEGFGLVYLEAMRLGRPCLVSLADAGQEVVAPPEAGLAVDPRDTGALAAATVRLLTTGPEWSRWSEQARRRYGRHFTADRFQARLLASMAEDAAPVAVA